MGADRYLLVRDEVVDYERFHEDPEDTFLLLEFDDAEAVRKFLAHDVEILDALSWATAQHEGKGFVLDEVEEVPYRHKRAPPEREVEGSNPSGGTNVVSSTTSASLSDRFRCPVAYPVASLTATKYRRVRSRRGRVPG